ncbi:hypothetical protein BKA69DRAFT_1076280 [Paraphysoderma sedebokerense]|nr:hypothetical protein BKA69DRAFT_1076280 [Paraphysoderma sedebokerense]
MSVITEENAREESPSNQNHRPIQNWAAAIEHFLKETPGAFIRLLDIGTSFEDAYGIALNPCEFDQSNLNPLFEYLSRYPSLFHLEIIGQPIDQAFFVRQTDLSSFDVDGEFVNELVSSLIKTRTRMTQEEFKILFERFYGFEFELEGNFEDISEDYVDLGSGFFVINGTSPSLEMPEKVFYTDKEWFNIQKRRAIEEERRIQKEPQKRNASRDSYSTGGRKRSRTHKEDSRRRHRSEEGWRNSSPGTRGGLSPDFDNDQHETSFRNSTRTSHIQSSDNDGFIVRSHSARSLYRGERPIAPSNNGNDSDTIQEGDMVDERDRNEEVNSEDETPKSKNPVRSKVLAGFDSTDAIHPTKEKVIPEPKYSYGWNNPKSRSDRSKLLSVKETILARQQRLLEAKRIATEVGRKKAEQNRKDDETHRDLQEDGISGDA